MFDIGDYIMHVKYLNILHLFLIDPRVSYRFVKSDIIDQVSTPLNETELLLNCWSEHFINQMILVFEELLKYDFKKITVVADQNSKANYYTLPTHITDRLNIIFIDSIHMLSARVVWGDRCESTWNTSATKGFFPTGKLARYNRIQLLEELYRIDGLDVVSWTFPNSKDQYKSVVDYYRFVYNHIPDDLDKFYSYCSHHATVKLEGISPFSYTKLVPWHNVTDHPIDLYKDASFILVAETESLDNISPLITEKIPLAVMNHRPFILSGRTGTLKRLEDLGFKTFTQYLPYPNYDSVLYNKERVKQTAENVKAFPTILQQHQEEISADIEHNYKLLNSIADQTEEKLKKLAKDYGLVSSNLTELFGLDPWVSQHYVHLPGCPNTHKPDGVKLRELENRYLNELYQQGNPKLDKLNQITWLEHYSVIKADSWPEITNEIEFNNLPDWIKTECILKFGCHPR